ncbi:hypothetical protein ACMX2H_15955 [Arthrobacter sulfonylureivorans]|uniref:hypothetical protein n=1 Tax=Arthrobacter sulfonylureivorans TaxID=2486855 RepID=UPI0039E31CE2
MSAELTEHELTTLVEAAAAGEWTSTYTSIGGPEWADVNPALQHEVRETAMPYVVHGFKALAGLGWERHRTVHTIEELRAVPEGMVIRNAHGTIMESMKPYNGYSEWLLFGHEIGDLPSEDWLPAVVLQEAPKK